MLSVGVTSGAGERGSHSLFVFTASSQVSLRLVLHRPRDTLQTERSV